MRLSIAPAAFGIAAALAFAPPAAAEYDIAYLGLRGSYVVTDVGSTQGSVFFDYNEEYADGFGAGIFIGWVLDSNFRFEIEGTFRSADLDEVTMVRDDFPYTTAGDVVDVGGDAQTAAAMVNVYYDLHLFDGPVLPWIGAGLGGAYIDYAIDATVPGDPLTVMFDGKDTTWAFAYQFMAGVTVPVGEGVSMSLAYRYFQTEDFVYVDVFGEEFETDITQHNVDLSLQFHL